MRLLRSKTIWTNLNETQTYAFHNLLVEFNPEHIPLHFVQGQCKLREGAHL